MTKSGLIETVAEATPHISKRDTEIVVNTIFESMAQAREAREGRNPKTGAPVHISAKRTPFFKVGKELKEMVDGQESGESGRPEPGFKPDDGSA